MKLSHTLLFLGAAGVGYKLFKDREQITTSVKETASSLSTIQESSQNIQQNLTIIQDQLTLLQDLGRDFSYKSQTFEKEAKARLHTIQEIWQDKSNQ